MPNSTILSIPQLTSGQAQAFTTVNNAIAALEQSANAALTIDMSAANKTLSVTEMTRHGLLRTTGNAVARTLTFPARTVEPPDSLSPYTRRIVAVQNGGSATLTVTVNVGAPTSVSLSAGEAAILYVEASSAADGSVTKLLSSAGGGGGGGSGLFTIGVYQPGVLTPSTLARYVFTETATFLDNFAGSAGSVTVNPSAGETLDIYRNATKIGEIAISTGGAVTFTTTGASTEVFNAGDVLSVVAASVVSAPEDLTITLKGTR